MGRLHVGLESLGRGKRQKLNAEMKEVEKEEAEMIRALQQRDRKLIKGDRNVEKADESGPGNFFSRPQVRRSKENENH